MTCGPWVAIVALLQSGMDFAVTEMPLANSSTVVFDSRVSVPGSRAPITCYRIPSIVAAGGNVILAFAEARLGTFAPRRGGGFFPSCNDCVVNGIAMRRSTDGGKTWGEYKWAVSDEPTDPAVPDSDVGGNPSAVYDVATGRVILQVHIITTVL